MLTGKMDRLITIQSNSPSQDSYGEPIESWSELDQVYAEKMNPRVAERFTGQQFAGFKGLVWRIRWRSDITAALAPLMRISYDSVTYGIKGVYEIGRNQELILESEAIV